MAHEFGAGPGATSAVFSTTVFVWGVLGWPSGHLADRFGPRPVIIVGAIAIGIGLLMTRLDPPPVDRLSHLRRRRRRRHRMRIRADGRRRRRMVPASAQHRARHRGRRHRMRHAVRRADQRCVDPAPRMARDLRRARHRECDGAARMRLRRETPAGSCRARAASTSARRSEPAPSSCSISRRCFPRWVSSRRSFSFPPSRAIMARARWRPRPWSDSSAAPA